MQASQQREELGYAKGGWLSVALSPLYPIRPFLDPPGLNALRREIVVNCTGGFNPTFPEPDHRGGTLAPESLVIEEAGPRNCTYAELNVFGLYFYRQSLLVNIDSAGTGQVMLVDEIFHRLNQFIGSATKFYNRIGYWGPLSFRVELDDLENCGLLQSATRFRTDKLFCRDPFIHISDTFLAAALETKRLDLLIRSSQQIAWGFGWDPERARLEEVFNTHIPR